MYYCNALSSAGRIQSRYTGHDRISSVSSMGRSNISTHLSLFQTSYYSSDHATDHIMTSYKSERRRTRRSRTQQISQLMCRLKDKIPFSFRKKQPNIADDTLSTGRYERFAHQHGASPSANGRPLSQPAYYFSTAARMARVQSLANNSPIILPFTTTSRISNSKKAATALQMVLSTPDTIIEQASTQKLLDTLLDESVRTQSRQPVMMQFNPKRSWIWRQWRGTVFSETWKSGLLNMALATFVVFLYGAYPSIKDLTQGFNILWGQFIRF